MKSKGIYGLTVFFVVMGGWCMAMENASGPAKPQVVHPGQVSAQAVATDKLVPTVENIRNLQDIFVTGGFFEFAPAAIQMMDYASGLRIDWRDPNALKNESIISTAQNMFFDLLSLVNTKVKAEEAVSHSADPKVHFNSMPYLALLFIEASQSTILSADQKNNQRAEVKKWLPDLGVTPLSQDDGKAYTFFSQFIAPRVEKEGDNNVLKFSFLLDSVPDSKTGMAPLTAFVKKMADLQGKTVSPAVLRILIRCFLGLDGFLQADFVEKFKLNISPDPTKPAGADLQPLIDELGVTKLLGVDEQKLFIQKLTDLRDKVSAIDKVTAAVPAQLIADKSKSVAEMISLLMGMAWDVAAVVSAGGQQFPVEILATRLVPVRNAFGQAIETVFNAVLKLGEQASNERASLDLLLERCLHTALLAPAQRVYVDQMKQKIEPLSETQLRSRARAAQTPAKPAAATQGAVVSNKASSSSPTNGAVVAGGL